MSKLLPGLRYSSGFTLVELIIVVSVIGILSAMALIGFTGVQASARDASRKQTITGLQNALERYYGDNQTYPPGSFCNNAIGTLVPTYLSSMPTDPCKTSGAPTPICSGTSPATLCSGTHPTYTYTNLNGGQAYTIVLTPETGAAAVTFSSPQ